MSLELANRLSFIERQVAVRATDVVYQRLPELEQRYGPAGRHRCEEDTALHLRFLASALAVGEPQIVTDYVAWLEPLLARFGVPREDLDANFAAIEDAVAELLPEASRPLSELLRSVGRGG